MPLIRRMVKKLVTDAAQKVQAGGTTAGLNGK